MAKIETDHKYFSLAIELQRMHIEIHKLLGVVKEFQEQLGDDSELTSLPPATVIDMYVKDIYRIVSELDEANCDEIDKSVAGCESLASTVVALQQENDSLLRRIDQIQSKKNDLEKRLVCIDELIVLARELKDENEGMIHDFKGLKDSIAVEQENDALEIVELTKSFKELIADNEMLRKKKEEMEGRLQQLQLSVHRFSTSSNEEQENKDATDDCRQALSKSSYPVVAVDSQVYTSDQTLNKEEAQKNNAFGHNGKSESEMNAGVQTTLEGKERCSAVADLMPVLSETTEMTSGADCVREDTEHNEHQIVVVSQQSAVSMDTMQLIGTTPEHDRSDEGREICDEEEANTKPDEFLLPECETVSAGKWTSRQTSTDSGESRGKDHDSNLGDSGLHRSITSQSKLAETELVRLLTSWEQLLAENSRLRSELAQLTAAPESKRTFDEDQVSDNDGEDAAPASKKTFGEDGEDSRTTAVLRHHATQLESEITALKRTVREQSVYLVSPGACSDDYDNEFSWAHPYECSRVVTDMDGEKQSNNEKDDDKGNGDVFRRQNALVKEKLENLKWNDHEASVDETESQLQEQAARLHDQHTTLLNELATETKQMENYENPSQRTVDEITDSYWSVLDEVDSRRTRLDDENDVDSRNTNEERTVPVFAGRLESWLKDYETLIGERNVQRSHGNSFFLCSIPEDQLSENTDDDGVELRKRDTRSLLTDVSSQNESVDGGMPDLQIPLEHTQLTSGALVTNVEHLGGEPEEKERALKVKNEEAGRRPIETSPEHTQLTADVFAANLEQLRAELKAKEEELRHRNEEIDRIRTENESLQIAASCPSSDYEEQLVSEIERLTFDRSMLQQRLQEAQYEAEETREELATEKNQLCRQLSALRQRAEDDKTAAVKNAELLMAENRRLCDELSGRENDFRTAAESHRAQQADWADRWRAVEEKLTTENGRLHGELFVITAERSQLQENCAKLENDCLAFQELSNEMLERCERLCIELERFKRSSEGGNVSASHTNHEDCRRNAEQAHRQVQTLKEENSRLAMILEMEKLKNFSDERPAMTDSQTDTADLELSASSIDGERLERGVRLRGDGDGGVWEDEPTSLLLGHARTARAAGLQLRHLLNARQAQIAAAVDGEQVPVAAVSTCQLEGIVDKLVVELDDLVKSLAMTDSEETMKDGRTNEKNCIDLTSADNNQLHELQLLLQVKYCKHFTTLYTVSEKTVQFCFCQNFIKFPRILISFDR